MSSEQLKLEVSGLLQRFPASEQPTLLALLQQLQEPAFSASVIGLAQHIEQQLTLLPEQAQPVLQQLLHLQLMVMMSPPEAWHEALEQLSH